jgi:hypothetical protein
MSCDELIDVLVEYSHLFIGEGKRKFLEDKNGCHIFIITNKGINRHIECFEEDSGLVGRFFGRKDVYCYDEYKGVKIGINLIYRLNRLRMISLTAFKKDVELIWPPKKRTKS